VQVLFSRFNFEIVPQHFSLNVAMDGLCPVCIAF
jgi:hypothetical protein